MPSQGCCPGVSWTALPWKLLPTSHLLQSQLQKGLLDAGTKPGQGTGEHVQSCGLSNMGLEVGLGARAGMKIADTNNNARPPRTSPGLGTGLCVHRLLVPAADPTGGPNLEVEWWSAGTDKERQDASRGECNACRVWMGLGEDGAAARLPTSRQTPRPAGSQSSTAPDQPTLLDGSGLVKTAGNSSSPVRKSAQASQAYRQRPVNPLGGGPRHQDPGRDGGGVTKSRTD